MNLIIILWKVESGKTLLEFEDNLKIFSLNGAEIGNFTIGVNQTIYKGQKCFNIKAIR